MPTYRIQAAVRSSPPLDQAVDHVTNTFYLEDQGVTSDPSGLAQDAADLWAGYRAYPQEVDDVLVRVYDMAHSLPRVPVAEATADIVPLAVPGYPREVALALSFFSETNRPRRRGRLFIGPWARDAGGIRPAAGMISSLATLAGGIAGLGGIDVDWKIYSPTTNQFHTVTDYWIDDEWDTIRSRGLRETARTTGTTSED